MFRKRIQRRCRSRCRVDRGLLEFGQCCPFCFGGRFYVLVETLERNSPSTYRFWSHSFVEGLSLSTDRVSQSFASLGSP
jgi:hypothetical protein